jgi:DNA-binding NtrC family response regulator
MQPRMLIVDDERTILLAMQDYFAACGYEVDCARDKQQAKALLAAGTYAVLITDLRLTGCDDTEGLDIVRHALARFPSICSILLTAYGTPDIVKAALDYGINVCLSKPRPLDEIAQTVSKLLQKAE